MKFGVFFTVRWHEEWTQEQSLLEVLERAELADQTGFDEIWLGEHHFSRHGILSGLFSFTGHVAARTKNARIGLAVVVLPFRNPIQVAEELATIDILSGGRLDAGVGSGYQRQEFEGLGVDVEESRDRFREAVDVIVRAWTEDKLTYDGRFTSVEDVAVLPKPKQKPHPPLYVAVSTSPATVDYAASLGVPVIVGGPTAALGIAPEVIALWREKMEEYGHAHAHVDPPVNMNIHVAPTVEEAERDAVGREDFSTKILAHDRLARRKGRPVPEGLRGVDKPAARPRGGWRTAQGRLDQPARQPRGRRGAAVRAAGVRDRQRVRLLRLSGTAARQAHALDRAVRHGGGAASPRAGAGRDVVSR